MFLFNGVWDPAMQRKMTGYAGIFILYLLAYAGALASGSPFFMRIVF